MFKKLLGYKIKDEFVDAYIKLFNGNYSKYKYLDETITFLKNSVTYKEAVNYGILNIWFDRVYEEEVNLPKINGYDGKFDKYKQSIQYGCAKFPFVYLNPIYQNIMHFNNVVNYNKDRYNRTIKSIELSSGVKISIENLKSIIKFLENK